MTDSAADPEPLLVVEDEPAQRDALVRYLRREGFTVRAVGSAEEALAELQQARFSALLTDLRLPGMDGIELVRRAQESNEELCTILLTAYASLETAIEALRAGVHDYILKPLFYEELVRKLRRLIVYRDLLRENDRLRAALQPPREERLIGDSPAMQQVREWVRRAAASRATVLITGETGTGKEVVAKAIHTQGPHADEPLLGINVAALPDATVESELFGHERGAFTGADRRRPGLLRAASSGSVFLDEIGEMTLAVQAKLLRALEEREVMPLGADAPVPFDARILCATHRDLTQAVRGGSFREDLYFRINVLHIAVPPLRQRPEDIPALARHLLGRHAHRSGLRAPRVTDTAMRWLCSYSWPGNVRELSNLLERALFLCEEGDIGVQHLPRPVARGAGPAVGVDGTLQEALDGFERGVLTEALRHSDGNREQAARALGLSPATLYRKLDKHGLKGFAVKERGDA